MNSIPRGAAPFPLESIPIPHAGGSVPAGFPSPAEDFDVERLSLVDLLTPHPLTTFLWRVSGQSMVDAGISDGDILVVDRSLRAGHGDVVVAQVDNDFTVKYLHRRGGAFKLVPANRTYPDIVPRDGQTVSLVGVVTSVIKQFRKLA
ncbi:LexA family protein [Dechloromonas sp. ARDL1]|uniref:LexA family protein n=1 Tax=Dechloromonas sp. ARDL1 TaxID=3322121 RepID=UPI003DA75286